MWDLPWLTCAGPVTAINLDNLDVTTDDEMNDHLALGIACAWVDRVGSWPPLPAGLPSTLMEIDHDPVFDKLHCDSVRHADSGATRRTTSRPDLLIWSVHNLPSYVMYGWETGIRNQFIRLLWLGMPKEQTMELVMFAQLYAGMRGLGHDLRGRRLPPGVRTADRPARMARGMGRRSRRVQVWTRSVGAEK